MRVTNKMLSNSFLADMRTNLEYMKKLQQQMTSGKEIRKPSDDPFKVARSMQLHTDINTNKQYNENINDTINWLDTTDTAVGQVGDVLQRVRELLISAGNAGYSSNERRAIKDEINEKIGEVSQILNTSFDGKYIFGGTRGTTKPVDVIGGSSFGNAASTEKIIIDKDQKIANTIVSDKGQLKQQLDIKVKFKPSGSTVETEKTISIAKDTEINSLSDLASKINEQIDKDNDLKDKIKVVPNMADNNLMFVNINEAGGEDPSNNYFKISATGDIKISAGSDTAKFSTNNTSNARLVYHKKSGGELVDGPEYNQIQCKLKVQISQGVSMDYNVTASEILEFKNSKGDSLDLRDIFNNITNHLDGKNDDGVTVDTDAIKELVNGDLQKLTDAMNNLLKIRSEVGAKQNRMDSAKDRNVDSNFNMTEILSKIEDIDITEKTMEYATMQTVYLASLQTSAKVLQPSLMDYLR
ncbi:flagellar hook-associated protein FlgL [Clostridium ganghwense]|uniref:Flagellar hook-associated protein FlgL n=1 Tax=Clostridium ganghwense TaxID=312089 RepID=A0ABT4CR01_9CLOT|nr:flagellar hook-associated protein FlgL [Clostridium ganghwense]MCY6370424.1 flagellar hook-associated protein FlgL [Clostridium ganghwense]